MNVIDAMNPLLKHYNIPNSVNLARVAILYYALVLLT